MGAFLLWVALGLVTQLWLCFRVARSSVPLAIAAFLMGPIGALYTLFKHHGEEETSVTTPFVANLVCCVLLVVVGWQQLMALAEGMPAEPGLAAAVEASEKEPGFTPTSLTAADPGGAAAPASAQEEAPPADPIDVLAADLRRVGVQSTVLRLPAATRLPEGVVSGAQLAMSSIPGAGEWMHAPGSASAPAGSAGRTELSVLFLRCDATTACRGVARAYMAQDPATRPRVLQNGSLLLLISNAATADTGHMHNVVASAFRHLPPQ
jgi:hypothetical protein